MQDNQLESRVTRLEERAMLQEEIRQERAVEIIRRLTGVESGVTDLRAVVNDLATETRSHVFKSTCTKVGSQTLLGGGAGAAIVTGLVALVWALKQLGLI